MDSRIKFTYRIPPDGIYYRDGYRLTISFADVFPLSAPYELFPKKTQVQDSGDLILRHCHYMPE